MSSQMLKVCLIEACEEKDKGSIGAYYIQYHAEMAGYKIDRLRQTEAGYDVELISVHHSSDFERLKKMEKKATWRLVGGHPMQNNPRPVIPFADAICIGEGETWIKKVLKILDETRDIEKLSSLSGTIVCKNWVDGQPLPPANIENPLPDNPPYLNHAGTKSAAWYIELGRGCPYRCDYCELGYSVPYRRYDADHIKKVIDMADPNITKKINFFAPDEASHPDYNDIYAYAKSKWNVANFSSMRVESILKNIPKVNKNHLIRIGIDGLTEETRKRVHKKITDDMIYEFFSQMIARGHINFKIFMIIGYPWDTEKDFDKWSELMERLFSIPLQKNVSLRIKWTPFIPQPCTPLGQEKPNYTMSIYNKVLTWHTINKRPQITPGWYIENDGIMSPSSHKKQCRLTVGDEKTLM